MSDKPLMRYDVQTDEMIPVTQEWVDHVHKRLFEFAVMRSEIRKLVNAPFVEMNGANELISRMAS